jgi:hypothetical protein
MKEKVINEFFLSLMNDNIIYSINEIINTQFFHHKTSMTNDKKMWTSICHLYDYKMIIVLNDVGGSKQSLSNVVVA